MHQIPSLQFFPYIDKFIYVSAPIVIFLVLTGIIFKAVNLFCLLRNSAAVTFVDLSAKILVIYVSGH